MLDNQDKTARRLSYRDHEAIRYFRYCGLTVSQIAQRLRVGTDAVNYRLRRYGLDAPVNEVEAVTLEMRAVFRETNRRLEEPDLSASDYVRLSTTQTKQALALLDVMSRGVILEDEEMSEASQTAKQRILALTDEEALHELRRVAGLEGKSAGFDETRRARASGSSEDEPVFTECDGGAAPSAE